ncbi:hypothetical protein ACFL2Q_16475 [Thermodesulfobacteriota bacterium]
MRTLLTFLISATVLVFLSDISLCLVYSPEVKDIVVDNIGSKSVQIVLKMADKGVNVVINGEYLKTICWNADGKIEDQRVSKEEFKQCLKAGDNDVLIILANDRNMLDPSPNPCKFEGMLLVNGSEYPLDKEWNPCPGGMRALIWIHLNGVKK